MLNLNSFIPSVPTEAEAGEETVVKCDDCSTTDSGSALDDESNCQYNEVSSSVALDACPDDDEGPYLLYKPTPVLKSNILGIDVSSGNYHQENEKNREQEPKGPYMYELFSIMIHSGSAAGGHYYAYIKDFQKNQWFCFNDQTVSSITEDDIHKTYGGGPVRGYYSGAYSSSTNAYMLMYRRIDEERNRNAMSVEEFPPHIKRLLKQIRDKEESDRAAKEREIDMFKLKIFHHNAAQNSVQNTKLFVFLDTKLSEAVAEARQRLKLEHIAPEDCRLCTYNVLQDCIECSFDDDELRFCDISSIINLYQCDWLLETKPSGEQLDRILLCRFDASLSF